MKILYDMMIPSVKVVHKRSKEESKKSYFVFIYIYKYTQLYIYLY